MSRFYKLCEDLDALSYREKRKFALAVLDRMNVPLSYLARQSEKNTKEKIQDEYNRSTPPVFTVTPGQLMYDLENDKFIDPFEKDFDHKNDD